MADPALTRAQLLARLAWFTHVNEEGLGTTLRQQVERHFLSTTGFYDLPTEDLLKFYTKEVSELVDDEPDWATIDVEYASWAKEPKKKPEVLTLSEVNERFPIALESWYEDESARELLRKVIGDTFSELDGKLIVEPCHPQPPWIWDGRGWAQEE